ncbi:MAG TPA: mandelate racemase/muconate lactonizing enzyme family protein [bacterium]|nr:mandelate racemase/muconate lactonizing enzyme family protein [bacterium]
MKISDVKVYVMSSAWRNFVFARVRTDEGLEGVGEARPVNREEAVAAYAEAITHRYVLGSDPFNLEDLVLRITRDDFEVPGATEMTAIAVIEMACWDIVGKALGQPVYRLLGGRCRDRIKAYANGWYQVARTPEEFAQAARRVVARGYRAMKFDPFGAGAGELTRDEHRRSVALVEAVRDAVGPEVELFVEMHGRFTAAQAMALARDLERLAPGWLEEPVPPDQPAALARVAAHTTLPIATGERLHTRAAFRDLFAQGAVDIAQPDLTHCGGLLETKKIAAMAETHGLMVAPHNVGASVSTAAALHLAACVPNFKIQEYFNDFDEPFVAGTASGLPAVTDGHFALPEGPGLGVTFDEDVVLANPYRRQHFNLFSDDWQRRQATRTP